MNSRWRQRPLTKLLAATSLAAGTMAVLLLTGGRPARADEQLSLVTTIDVGSNGLGAFDISDDDPAIDLYVLADRTNGSVDMVDASDDRFMGRIGGFTGNVVVNGKADASLSGPDGVVIVDHKQIWAGDGDSTMKIIDIASGQIIDTISTGGKFRVDEMAWDSRDHLVAAANNADTPPFVTVFDTTTHKIVGKITFDGTNGTPDTTNGIEQPQWSPQTGMFYVSVPQVGPNVANGGVSVIDPHTVKVVTTYPVQNCTPGGLTLGPRHQALIGCSGSFGTSPNVVTQSVVIDIKTGNIVTTIPVGGNDEVWYDRGSNHYYLPAHGNLDNTGNPMPELAFVDGGTNMLDGAVPMSTSSHSVAASRLNQHVFLPVGFVPPGSPAGTDPNNPCPTRGCIAVYAPSGSDNDHIARDIDHFMKEASR